jgi:DNA-binding Lrp family transcriptional regulator
MSDARVTPELRRFILSAFPSVPHLEALLLLRERDAGWTFAELAARLYVAEAAAARLVGELAEAGLIRSEGDRAAYAPVREGLRTQVDHLAAIYARNVVAVSELIHSTTERKAFNFADAFRLRKDGE